MRIIAAVVLAFAAATAHAGCSVFEWPENCSIWEGGACADEYAVQCGDLLFAADQHARRKLEQERRYKPRYACWKYALAARNFLVGHGAEVSIRKGSRLGVQHTWVETQRGGRCYALDVNEGITACEGLYRLMDTVQPQAVSAKLR